jgi:hypothetical protein
MKNVFKIKCYISVEHFLEPKYLCYITSLNPYDSTVCFKGREVRSFYGEDLIKGLNVSSKERFRVFMRKFFYRSGFCILSITL